jgi:GAF domain-containing protein
VHRGQLFRKYFLLILGLVCGALLISGGISLYFAYQENKEALANLQREKAAGAASRIEQFVSQIEQQLAFAALPQLGAEGLEQRRIEFLKLLRVVPAVTDIAQIDAKGREQLAVSRLKMDTAGANEDRSQEPAFKNARPNQTWFGPVYFRKETEPYMSIAVRSGGESGPVTVAEVNLKFIWDVVTRIRIGQKGKAYVVDSTGHLVADPDIGLVLRKTNLSELEQVKAAFAPGADDSLALIAKDLAGNEVLTAYAPIEPGREAAAQGKPWSPLGWKVFVEQPASEMYAALDATIWRTVALIVAGLLFSALAALWLARNMVRPIGVLQDGAQRIGAGDLEQKIDVRTGDELEALASQFNHMTEQLRESYAGLERKVEERTAQLTESLAYQTATGEILQVISSSPTNVQPVFDVIGERAARLCEATFGWVFTFDGEWIRIGSLFGSDPQSVEAFRREFPMRVSAQSVVARTVRTGSIVHLPDVLADPEYSLKPVAELTGYRAALGVPMVREGQTVGAITVARPDTGFFTDKQVELLKTFASQAVIAIENVRLFNETKEALERQTATSDILRVISGATTDVQPVFEAIVKNAVTLCDAMFANAFSFDGESLHFLASTTKVPGHLQVLRDSYPMPPSRSQVSGRTILAKSVVRLEDTQGDPDYDMRHSVAGTYRKMLGVPLMREGNPIGAIVVGWKDPGAIPPAQEQLLKTFADQAVIAVENVRLFNETKESLERQTATAEILKVISSTPTDVQPVFDAIVRHAVTLCDAKFASAFRYDGEQLHFLASTSPNENFVQTLKEAYPMRPDRSQISGRTILSKSVERLEDALADPEYTGRMAIAGGWRRMLGVPLLREGHPIGAIVVGWEQPGPIPPVQEELLKTFADQAVIAVENVRLFNETKESLERQTATSDILRVISSSTTDVQPVFEEIVQSGLKLFPDALVSVALPDGDRVRLAAVAARDPEHCEQWRKRFPFPLTRAYMHGVSLLERRPIDVPDVAAITDPLLASGVKNFLESGLRAQTTMPMLRGEAAIGAISVVRRTPGPLTDKQIALLRTFADQAVIAIENVRLFNETKEALEQQTAISEILRVISASPGDVTPVFEAVAQRAGRICDARVVDIVVPEGDRLRVAATFGHLGRPQGTSTPLDRSTVMGRSIVDKAPVHLDDLQNAGEEFALGRELARKFGHRTILAMPLVRGEKALGTILLRRAEVRPFEEKHIALLQTFADQAAIAIENVRLFNETKESLEQQTATSEILRVISDSPGDVKPILDAVAERATRLCDTASSAIYVLEDGVMRRTAFHGPVELVGRETVPYSTGSLAGRAIVEGKPIHVHDIESAQTEYPISWEFARQFGRKQTMLAVPLLREGKPFGTMFLRRREVRPFTDKEIALAKVFADQAAIGIQNVRLFNETKEALEQQKASAEVLSAISSSIADTQPVFDRIARNCEHLFAGVEVIINLIGDDGKLFIAGHQGAHREHLQRSFMGAPVDRDSGAGRCILEKRSMQYPDIELGEDVPPVMRANCAATDVKAAMYAPLVWEDRGIGAIFVGRRYKGPFTEKEMGLLKTFADQAVIAIQNSRLFREIQEKSAQLEIANKHKSDFLANMSHELRTPLNAIIGFSEVLSERMFGEINEKQADYLKDIHESGKHLLSLINDILDLSKIEAGRMDLEISTFDLPAALSNAMTLVRERAQRHGIELALEVDNQLGSFQADERKFKQIVLNLLSNAVKFTPDGGRVSVSAKKDTTHVEIAVKDTGIGIAPEDQAAVFEEFKQVGRDYTKKAEGTGLGLTLTKRFVELHGGEIRLESALGNGSTFTITFPIRQ